MKLLRWTLIGGGGFLAYSLIFRRRELGALMTTAEEVAFRFVVPERAKYLVDPILAAARKYEIDPFVLLAIAKLESNFGDALTPRGPAGTGDFAPRPPRKQRGPRTPPPGGYVREDGYAVPKGRGWGHGVFQIDWESHRPFIESGAWKDPTTAADYAARTVIKPNVDALKKLGLQGEALLKAAVAAYNTGLNNVISSLRAGRDPDTTTAHGKYASTVLSSARRYVQEFEAAKRKTKPA